MYLKIIAVHASPVTGHFFTIPSYFAPGKPCVAPVSIKSKDSQDANEKNAETYQHDPVKFFIVKLLLFMKLLLA
jgi:hypothetical protein